MWVSRLTGTFFFSWPDSDLDEALLVLPFTYAVKLMPFLSEWVRRGAMVERSVRCLVFLVRCAGEW